MSSPLQPLPIGGVTGSTQAASALTDTAWRPPEWVKGTDATLTITATQPTSGVTEDGDATAQPTTVMYVFDGAVNTQHQREMVVTQHPIQTGSSISDHAFLQNPQLMVEIMMSDAMQSYVVGQFMGAQSRSLAAYQVLQQLQDSRSVLQVSTRLAQYSNMLITQLAPDETSETRFALKCKVTFTQITVAGIDANYRFIASNYSLYGAFPGERVVSARSQMNLFTLLGSLNTLPVSDAITEQHELLPFTDVPVPLDVTSPLPRDVENAVPNGGTWSSMNVSNVPVVLGPVF